MLTKKGGFDFDPEANMLLCNLVLTKKVNTGTVELGYNEHLGTLTARHWEVQMLSKKVLQKGILQNTRQSKTKEQSRDS